MTLDFHYSFCPNSVAFYNSNSVLFSAGKLCVLFDLDAKSQKCFQFTEGAEVSKIVRCGILIAGAIRGHPPSVCLFNTLSETRKLYSGPETMQSEEFSCLSVSINLKFIAAQGATPDWLLVIWLSQTREIAAIINPVRNAGAEVFDISFHAVGRDELVVIGKNIFKLYECQPESEGNIPVFEEIVFEKLENAGTYLTIGWPEKENLAVGSSEGHVLFFRGIELVHEMSLEDDLKQETRYSAVNGSKAVTSIVVIPQQILCAFSGFVVMVYVGEEIACYTLAKLVFMQQDILSENIPGELQEEPDFLLSILVSLDDQDLIGTTRDGQILRCLKFNYKGKCQHFTSLLQKQHNNPVIGIDVARSKPLLASCSEYSLIVWNILTKKQEIKKQFKNRILSVAVHPTGLYIALGFDHHCRLFSILYHNLREKTIFACKKSSLVRFSSGGHLLAMALHSVIEIYFFTSSELLFKLDGHAGLITSFDWIDNDAKLVSCDARGVICEWDLVAFKKKWENTAILSYLSVAESPSVGVIVIGSDKSIRCFDKSVLLWTLKSTKDMTCTTFCCDGKSFYIGTADGFIELYTYPISNKSGQFHAHSGKVTELKVSYEQCLLISSGFDGCIFLWKLAEEKCDITEGYLSRLCLVDTSHIEEQKIKIKQLNLSLQHTDAVSDCEYNIRCVKHKEDLRVIVLAHEQKVENLNEKIFQLKEEKTNILFDSVPKVDIDKLNTAVRKEIIDTTVKLNETYKNSNVYSDESNKIILDYENTINELSEKHAKSSCAESNVIEQIVDRIKYLEQTISLEWEGGQQTNRISKEYEISIEEEMTKETKNLRILQRTLFKRETLKYTELQTEIKRLKQMIDFKVQDIKKRKNITAGQVDYDIKEKVNAINLLEINYHDLEKVLAAKEKICHKQEKKFCDMRQLVGSFKKSHSVSNTSVDELMIDINAKQLGIQSCQEDIKKVTSSIPCLEEKVESIEEVCSTITEKLGETIDGYQKKEKTLRDIQDIIKKYFSMLHQCVSKDCDPMKLLNDVLHLFEESKAGFDDESFDPHLLNEYNFQIRKLKSAYDDIKSDPSKSMRDASMAEFRLSQENSKILRSVHTIQKDAEQLRLVIGEMEAGLGIQEKSGEMRHKIEFVLDASKRKTEQDMEEISKLDVFIEEQQREIERFQTMLASPRVRESSSSE